MFASYIKTAIRNFSRNKLHFSLNLFGLSIGLASVILVSLFVFHELSYDKHQPNGDLVYRIDLDFSKLDLGVIPGANYQRAKKFFSFSQVEDIFSLIQAEDVDQNLQHVRHNTQLFKLNKLYIATPNILDFIKLDIISGDIQESLSSPWLLALSKSEAIRLFGTIDVIGNKLINQLGNYKVAAVFADLNENTHFNFKSLTFSDLNKDDLRSHMHYVYLRLKSNTDLNTLEQSLTKNYAIGPEVEQLGIKLKPLHRLHLEADSAYEMKVGGSQQAVITCIGLSALLLTIACFNFINMSIAQAMQRSKEVGIRKALGASKAQLVTQFLLEAILIAFLSMLIACAIVEMLLPLFNQLVDRNLILNFNIKFISVLLIFAFIVGCLAGAYPALFLSSFNSKQTLSGEFQTGGKGIHLRKVLIIIQSALSISLLIGTFILPKQLAYLQSIPSGYEKSQRLLISGLPKDKIFKKQGSTFIRQLERVEGVKQVGLLDTKLTKGMNYSFSPVMPNGEKTELAIAGVGTGFSAVSNLGLKLLAGRDFSSQHKSDWLTRNENGAQVATIITQSVAQLAGFTQVDKAIGTIFTRGRLKMKVVGVVSDVNVGNVRNEQSSIFFLCGYTLMPSMSVLVTFEQNDLANIKQAIKKIAASQLQVYEADISLVKQNYQATFQQDQRISDVVKIFSILAIVLTCLGIFGLASFTALRRQKEIAIRKVLGASRFSLVNLLAKEFLLLVLVSLLIAFPLSYWLVNDWLANFNNRIDQTVWIYLISALVITTITWLTVASIAFKAASTRPALILRDE